MCGIVGYSTHSGAVALLAESLTSAVEALALRGPDGSGILVDDEIGVGVGHTRLAIVDLSDAGKQPMITADGRYSITYNGELYNIEELRDRLRTIGQTSVGRSDTEVLLKTLVAYGIDAHLTLNGIFAFAFVDHLYGNVTIARDGMGVKPLYYANGEDAFLFSSKIKSLMTLSALMGEIDGQAIDRYLTYHWCLGEGTPASGIRKLEPGHYMIVRNGVMVEQRQWYRLPALSVAPSKLGTLKAVDVTRALLRQAVHRQMVSDVPVGAFLSDGLDSSAIVAFATEVDPNIQCFSIDVEGGQDDGVVDDLPYAREAAKVLNVDLHVIKINAAGIASDIYEIVRHLEVSLADTAPLSVLYMSQLAQSRGVKVMLSGAGRDDLFCGYRRHQAVVVRKYIQWMPSALLDQAENVLRSFNQRNSLNRTALKFLAGRELKGDDRLAGYFSWASRWDLDPLYAESFKIRLGNHESARPLLDFISQMDSRDSDIDKLIAFEQRFFLTDHNLIYTDRMAMAAGVEVRVPFLDNQLVEFAATIPHELKQLGLVGKWVLREAMKGILPRQIVRRPKTGFGAPMRRWLRNELRDLVKDLLSRETILARGIFDYDAVHKIVSDDLEGRKGASYTIRSLICIEMWFRLFGESMVSRGNSLSASGTTA